MAVDDEHAGLVRDLGARSVIVVPLMARGQKIGSLTLSSATPGRYGRWELDLAIELARRAAIAIDNAQLYRASQQAVVLREEFLAVASHELFTPTTALRLALQTLSRSAGENQDLKKAVQLASRQGERLQKLISDLLDLTRLEKGVALELAPVSLEEIVRDVLSAVDQQLVAAGCEVSVRGEGVTGLWDRRRLERVVTNLVANAVKFGAGHPIEISIGERGGVARLTVTDHGIGIDPARLPHIFERFERAVSTRHYGGLGLGLYISRSIVEGHGGSIRAESQPGAGTTFIVELPCTR
jgi:signal transduction histidine kinase